MGGSATQRVSRGDSGTRRTAEGSGTTTVVVRRRLVRTAGCMLCNSTMISFSCTIELLVA